MITTDDMVAKPALGDDLRVTDRNTEDLVNTGIELIDPWSING